MEHFPAPVAIRDPHGHESGPFRAVLDGDRLVVTDNAGVVRFDLEAERVAAGRRFVHVTTPEGRWTVVKLCPGCNSAHRRWLREWDGTPRAVR